MRVKHIVVPFGKGANIEGIEESARNVYKNLACNKIIIDSPDIKDLDNPKLINLNNNIDINNKVAKEVKKTFDEGEFPLIVGGDHSISIGSVSAASEISSNLGLIWVDAHGDMNTEEITHSGNIHGMSLAALQGFGNDELTNILYKGRKINSKNVVIFGSRDFDTKERELIEKLNLKVISYKDIEKENLENSFKKASNYLKNVKKIHISFDLDVIDPTISPGVSVPVPKGFNFKQSKQVIEYFFKNFDVISMDLVEYNHRFDVNNKTYNILIELIKFINRLKE